MSATSTANGKPRKQLADEIDRIDRQMGDRLDRLDSIIDALAEGLPGAVTDACREGAREAVRTALVEVLSNPELRALLVPPPAPAQVAATAAPTGPRKPGLWGRIKARIAAARAAVAGTVRKVNEVVVRRCGAAGGAVAALGRVTGEPLPVRRVLLVGLGVGVAVGTASLLVPQTTAAVISGVGAAGTSVSVQTGRWLARAARRVGLLG